MVKAHITRCKRGHEYTPENTHWSTGNSGKPQRLCKTCKSDRARARHAAMIAKINAAFARRVDIQQK